MPDVKDIWVRIKAIGAQETKDELSDIAHRADEISHMDPTIKIGVKDEGLLRTLSGIRLQLEAMRLGADKSGLGTLANDLRDIGNSADAPRVKLNALRLEMQALRLVADGGGGAGGAGGGGLVASLGALFGGGGGVGSFLTSTGGLVGMGALAASGILGVIPGLLGAGAGLGAFGALAFPDISKIMAGYTAYSGATTARGRDTAIDAVPGGLRGTIGEIMQLKNTFDSMAHSMQPALMPIFNELGKIANTLLPNLLPLAKAVAPAIDGLLKEFEKFASSPGFHQFITQLAHLAGPWVKTFGQTLGQLAVAVGKLIMSFANPNAMRAFRILVDLIAWTLQGLAWVIERVTSALVYDFHQWAVTFDNVRRAFATAGHDIATIFDAIRHAIATAFDAVRASYQRDAADVNNWVRNVISFAQGVIRWFEQLPGRIVSALAALPGMLFSAGQRAIQSLINGITSMAGSVGSAVSSIASKVAGFFGLSPAVEGPLSGSGAPEIRGRHFAQDFARGMSEGTAGVGSAAALLAHSALFTRGPGGYGAATGGMGNVYVTVNVPPTANMADLGRQLALALGEYKRRGGWIWKPAGF